MTKIEKIILENQIAIMSMMMLIKPHDSIGVVQWSKIRGSLDKHIDSVKELIRNNPKEEPIKTIRPENIGDTVYIVEDNKNNPKILEYRICSIEYRQEDIFVQLYDDHEKYFNFHEMMDNHGNDVFLKREDAESYISSKKERKANGEKS